MAPIKGPFSLVVPIITVTFDDYSTIAVMFVPAAMQPAIVRIELCTRRAIVTVAIIIPVAADADTKALGARNGRRCNRESSQRRENARKLLHVASPVVVACRRKRKASRGVPGTNAE